MIPRRGPTGPSSVPKVYELMVSGTIGPVVRSCFPEFASVPVTTHSVLTGSCRGPEELRRLLDFLDARGFPPTVIHFDHHGNATTPDGSSRHEGSGP